MIYGMTRGSLVLIFGLASCAVLSAQNSGIQGVISDPTGAAVPDVAVTITNAATGIVTTARTNESGFYSAPFLPTATYKVAAEKAGFSPVSLDNLKLDVDQTARVDFTLRS